MRKLKNEELDRLSVEEFKKTEKIPIVVVLDNVRSMNNIGSVFRTSDAFLIEKIVLCGITATPPNKEIHKTALGSTESVEWVYVEDTIDAIEDLKKDDFQIVSVEQAEGSVFLNELKILHDQKYAIVIGNEVKGVQQKVVDASDMVLELPQHGTKHSLNVSVCTGIVLWEFFKVLK